MKRIKRRIGLPAKVELADLKNLKPTPPKEYYSTSSIVRADEINPSDLIIDDETGEAAIVRSISNIGQVLSFVLAIVGEPSLISRDYNLQFKVERLTPPKLKVVNAETQAEPRSSSPADPWAQPDDGWVPPDLTAMTRRELYEYQSSVSAASTSMDSERRRSERRRCGAEWERRRIIDGR